MLWGPLGLTTGAMHACKRTNQPWLQQCRSSTPQQQGGHPASSVLGTCQPWLTLGARVEGSTAGELRMRVIM